MGNQRRWEDLKFGLEHFSDIDRLACVGEKAWEHGMALMFKPFTRAAVRYFDKSEMAEAREWISAELPANTEHPASAG